MSLGVTTSIPAGALGSQQSSWDSVPGGLHGVIPSCRLCLSCSLSSSALKGCILRGQLLVHVPQYNNAVGAYKHVEMRILPIDDTVHWIVHFTKHACYCKFGKLFSDSKLGTRTLTMQQSVVSERRCCVVLCVVTVHGECQSLAHSS